MFDLLGLVRSAQRSIETADRRPRTRRHLRLESLEARALLATLADIPDIDLPARQGYQVPLDGGAGNAQTYTVTSDNPEIVATVAQGQFWSVTVNHASSGGSDPAFSGTLVFQMFEDLTPLTTSRIETLINQGFYINKNFHRIANLTVDPTNFIVQGGSVNGDGTGDVNQPGFPFPDEFLQQLTFANAPLNTDPNSIYSTAGQLAMANAGDDTNGSQFFITTGDQSHLNYQHTIFGQLVSGQETLAKMTQVARTGTTPTSPILITASSLSTTNPDGVVHLNATGATAGETATVTVTATDPNDNTTVTKSFEVTVEENDTVERPFISPAVPNQVVGLTKSDVPVQGQTAVFQIPIVNSNPPGTAVRYVVQGGISGTTFTPVVGGTASVDANGVVTVRPNPGFTGVINLVVGVGRSNASPSVVGDFDTQRLTLTVAQTGPINLQPIALDGTSAAVRNTPSPVQLAGLTANPQSQQTLVYEIVTQPAHGTITSFDAAAGTFQYVPQGGFEGTDTVEFRVKDQGDPGPSLYSTTATQTIIVGGGETGAVRLINRVLVVSPPPRRDSAPNTISVHQQDDTVRVFVNGQLDAIQPTTEEIDRLVVYGSKADDIIDVSPEVTVQATLDGGQGGVNQIKAGGALTRGHVWFGRNTFQGGAIRNVVVGGTGKFRTTQLQDGDGVFAGQPIYRPSLHKAGVPPEGQLFQVVDGQLRPRAIPTHGRRTR